MSDEIEMLYESTAPTFNAEYYSLLLKGLVTVVSLCTIATVAVVLWLAGVLMYCQQCRDNNGGHKRGSLEMNTRSSSKLAMHTPAQPAQPRGCPTDDHFSDCDCPEQHSPRVVGVMVGVSPSPVLDVAVGDELAKTS